MKTRSVLRALGGAIAIALVVVIALEHQAITDWWRLQSYNPPAKISKLAKADTMTGKAKHYFYLNRPKLVSQQKFSKKCPASTEQTVVLGCYHGNEAGIFLLRVKDSRLHGVEQVTAAHEMLHAVYGRLGGGDKQAVDNMLKHYYHHGLHNKRVRKIIQEYKHTEPHQLTNEMHSIFGTEIAKLPKDLDRYYRRYFVDRQQVVKFSNDYQAAFQKREAKIKRYDQQLASLHSQIQQAEATLHSQHASLQATQSQLQQYKSSGQYQQYNALVPRYNASVDSYNAKLTSTKQLIDRYNHLVTKRNNIAVQEKQLLNELKTPHLETHHAT
jgi:hypothetical protein